MTRSTVSGHVGGEEARFTPADIRLIWGVSISVVVGAKGPFPRPRNSENLHNLSTKSRGLAPKVIPMFAYWRAKR